ncbi:rhomboid family intramembrane serine protease [Pseudoalteromonas sp. MMG013]|uniref:rhomboid family intramembrane serine protease n=1 Tax=Pseudoalteromonas sp. MMG013 TaxID=2822687 RepID=UPI001B380701|nr:rhomboid family intramembrane serine protease [Pseudoalteromonas sp. MMG013]MBQ4861597.1 rhomboid family intramembrane serine protease [Pseudoalteromonas sp. MMG013]
MPFRQSIKIIAVLLLIMLLIQLLNTVTNGIISQFGIIPRTTMGLIGIPLAPWIHHNWLHLASNAIPLALLSFLALQNGFKQYILVFAFITLVAGSGVWLLGSAAHHAGASLIIFGLWGYLLALAFLQRNVKNIFIAIVVFFIYGGLAFSLLSYQPNISWSSHFFGMLAGLLAAQLFKNNGVK